MTIDNSAILLSDNYGQTPLHLACLSGNLNSVQILVEQEVELESVDFNGNTPKKLAEGMFIFLKGPSTKTVN